MKKYLGFAFVALGIALLLTGYIYANVVLNIESTPPTPPVFTSILPANGAVYPQTIIVKAVVSDPDTGVKSVTVTIDTTAYTLTFIVDDIWKSATNPTLTLGSHTFSFTATNNVGLQSSVSGSFTVVDLNGDWYINDVLVTSATENIYLVSPTVAFKFVKTSAYPSDSQITVKVSEGTTTLLTLTNSATATWTGSYTFVGGKHTLTLKASDGTKDIIMSVLSIDFGSSPIIVPFSTILYGLGGTSILFGIVLLAIGKKLKAK